MLLAMGCIQQGRVSVRSKEEQMTAAHQGSFTVPHVLHVYDDAGVSFEPFFSPATISRHLFIPVIHTSYKTELTTHG